MKKILKKNKKKIAIIYKGLSFEKKISIKTAQAVAKVLKKQSYDYVLVEADSKLQYNLQKEKPDVAFLAVHGIYGEDGIVQSICESLSLPYTGSGILASCLCMDKVYFKKVLQKNKIAIPPFQVLDKENLNPKVPFQYPVVVKASHGGSSLGTYIVKNKKDLSLSIQKAQKIGSSVFIEKYIKKAKEVTVSYFNKKILSPIEIVPKGSFYDYKRKYEKNQSQYYIPARLDPFVIEKLKKIAQKVFDLTKIRSYARADFLIENQKKTWLIEVNTLPGLTQHSLLPKSAAYDGIDFSELIESLIDQATTDYKF